MVAAASAEAAAARELGFTGGGITACLGDSNSGVVNILSLDSGGEPALECGLLVMASRTALRGGVLARCAMIVLVLDLGTVPWPRILAMELAVGANSLDVALDGLKMDALLRLSSLLLMLPLLLLLVPSGAVPATPGPLPGTRLVNVDEREAPLVSFVLVDNAALTEDRILRWEPIGPPPTDAGFNIFVVPELIRKLGCRDWDVLPFASANALLDAEELARTGAKLFLLANGASKGRDGAGREGFFGGGAPGFVSSATLDLIAAVVVAVFVFDAFVGEPTPKFHTLRTIDLADDRIPKRGVALPLSIPSDHVSKLYCHQRERSEKEGGDVLLTACGPTWLALACLLLLLFPFLTSSIFLVAALSLSACLSSVPDFLGEMVSRRPLSIPPSSSRILTRFDIRLSSSSCTSYTMSSSSPNPPGIPIRL